MWPVRHLADVAATLANAIGIEAPMYNRDKLQARSVLAGARPDLDTCRDELPVPQALPFQLLKIFFTKVTKLVTFSFICG